MFILNSSPARGFNGGLLIVSNYQIKKKIVLLASTVVLVSFSTAVLCMRPIIKPLGEKKELPVWSHSKTNGYEKKLPNPLAKIKVEPESKTKAIPNEITPLAGSFSLIIDQLKQLEDIPEEFIGDDFEKITYELDQLTFKRSLAEFMELSSLRVNTMDNSSLLKHLNEYMDFCQQMLKAMAQNEINNRVYLEQINASLSYIKSCYHQFKNLNQQATAALNKKYVLLLKSYQALNNGSGDL